MGSDWIENLLNEYERKCGTTWRFKELNNIVSDETATRCCSRKKPFEIIWDMDIEEKIRENSTIHPFKKERFVVSEDGDISIEGGVVF